MADGVKISRGNLRSSSVGEEEDVEEVRYRTTTTLDPSSIIAVEDCGIPLDCASAGDSFEPQDPCENLDLTFYNVMGQEDQFRQIDGKRADRGGIGRIVFTTVQDVVIEKIEYVLNPSDEDNPTFQGDKWNPNPPAKNKQEVFVPVSPDSLYAFKITISVEGCPDTNTSGIYYFSTGDDVVFQPDGVKLATPTLTVFIDVIELSQNSGLKGTTTGYDTIPPSGSGQILSSQVHSTLVMGNTLSKSVSISTSFNTS